MAGSLAAKAPATQAKKSPVFVWEAKNKGGELKKGEMEAADVDAVNARLRNLGYTPTKVKKKASEFAFRLPGVGGVGTRDLVIFTRQFATMIDAGLPLVQCLDIISQQVENLAFRDVLSKVKGRVESGSTFADALMDHPKVFDELYSQLVAAGEVGGILDTILNRLAAYMEKNEKLVRKVKGAMIYPAIVLFVGVLVTAVLLLKVTPVFEKMFHDFGGEMPAPTQFVIDFSHFAQDNFITAMISIAIAVFLFRAFYQNPRGRRLFDKFVLKSPLFGDLIRKVAVARFTRTLGTMISSGVPILDGLEVVAKTAGNRTIEDAIYYTRTKISEGKTITQPLMETGIFPNMVVQMIGIGEATGAMDQMLNKIADFYDDEVDQAVAGLTSLIEPIMMVFLGGVVGGFLIAMYLPIFSIAGAIK
jgi:type IV pilus assembly protein PilC